MCNIRKPRHRNTFITSIPLTLPPCSNKKTYGKALYVIYVSVSIKFSWMNQLFGYRFKTIELERGLWMNKTHFNMDIAIEGFHHFKVVYWMGIPMGWEGSANDQSIVYFFKLGYQWFDNGFKLYWCHQLGGHNKWMTHKTWLILVKSPLFQT